MGYFCLSCKLGYFEWKAKWGWDLQGVTFGNLGMENGFAKVKDTPQYCKPVIDCIAVFLTKIILIFKFWY